MRIRESGMPNEEQWEKFFDVEYILKKLGVDQAKNVADFGSGYGTFTIPAALMIKGMIYAIDIDPIMIKAVEKKAKTLKLKNLKTILCDFISQCYELEEGSFDFVMLFNILHGEKPIDLLKEAHRVLTIGGKIGIIHWNYDESTPRGPPMKIRPKPEQIRQWAESVGFIFEKQVDLKPYHYGIIFRK